MKISMACKNFFQNFHAMENADPQARAVTAPKIPR
jgi:hypothetical protein